MENKTTQEVSFVTRKMLVTFTHSVCLMINGSAVFANAAICEVTQQQESGSSELFGCTETRMLRVIGLPDGKKLTKSYNLQVGYGQVVSMCSLDESDMA